MVKHDDALIGKEFGHCRIERKLGAGGMGAVYLAHHTGLNKPVAIKVLPKEVSSNAEFIERFVREARLAARLEHPNVVQVFDVGVEQGTHYITMQYVEGRSLDVILKEKGKFSPGEAVAITKRVATALAAAHRLGIVHRDIKPANILLSKEGVIKVADFGLAKDTDSNRTVSGTGQIVGTPYYMSPEQAQGISVDARSDLYSLGATLYHLLTGRKPFDAPTPIAIVVKHIGEEPRPPREIDPSIPERICIVLAKMMAKKPEARQASAEELIRELDALKAGPASTIKPPPPKRSVRRAAIIALPIAGILVIGIAVGLMLGHGDPVKVETPTAAVKPTPPKPVEKPTEKPVEKPPPKVEEAPRQKIMARMKDAQEKRLTEDLLGRVDEFLRAIQKRDPKAIRAMLDRLSFGEPSDEQIAETFFKMSTTEVQLAKWEVEDVDLRVRGPLGGKILATCQLAYTLKIPKGEMKVADQPLHWVHKAEGWFVTRPPKSAADK